MSKNLFLFIAISFWLLVSLACKLNGFMSDTPKIEEAQLSKDDEGQQLAESFAPDDTFYCLVKLSAAAAETQIKARWMVVQTEDTDFKLDETQQPATTEQPIHFKLVSQIGLWPAGSYKVELYLDDNETPERILEFQVEDSLPVPTALPGDNVGEPTATPVPMPSQRSQSADAQGRTDQAEGSETEPLPISETPYVHPSGAFSFNPPLGWIQDAEDETGGRWRGRYTRKGPFSYVGGMFLDAAGSYDQTQLQQIVEQYVPSLVRQFTNSEPEILEDKPVPAQNRHQVSLRYPPSSNSPDESGGDIDIYFEQHDTIVFILYFVSPEYSQLLSTWTKIRGGHTLDPVKASTAVTSLGFAPLWRKPTPTPSGPDIPPGKGMFIFINNAGFTIILDIISPKTQQTLIEAQRIPSNSSKSFPLIPGEYTYRATQEGANRGVQTPPIFYVGEGKVVSYSVH